MTYMLNQDIVPITYCRSDWVSRDLNFLFDLSIIEIPQSAVLDWVAFNCQAQQNAHGGLCVATDQSWYIQCVPADLSLCHR